MHHSTALPLFGLFTLGALAILAVWIRGWAGRRSGTLDETPRDVLLVAPHQDDAVIMAGEYGIEASRAGKTVRIVYVTCGDSKVRSPRAAQRRAEAKAAWALAGVPEGNLTFLDAPSSPLRGPLRLDEAQLAMLETRLTMACRAMPRGAAIVVPAEGESHADHRACRTLSLRAVAASGRQDLLILEGPLYNSHASVLHSPGAAALQVFRRMALVGSIVRRAKYTPRAGFVSGEIGKQLRSDPMRLDLKKRMLRTFSSEDGDLLARHFGRRDWLRQSRSEDTAHALGLTPGAEPAALPTAASVRALTVLSLLGSFLLGYASMTLLWELVGRAGPVAALAAAGGGGLTTTLMGLRRKLHPIARASWWFTGAGLGAAWVALF